MKSALTIAGSDSSGGAGIQADIKTMSALGVYAQTVITALTAQNTLGVRDVLVIDAHFVREQIDCVFEDITPQAVKIGMIASPDLVYAIADGLRAHQAQRVVLDPVMVATSGAALSSDATVQATVEALFPLADVVTPNLPEAEVLADMRIQTPQDAEEAARRIQAKGAAAVLVKGGHGVNEANDYLLTADGAGAWLSAERIATKNTHGTGCTLSSAIAAYLAQDVNLAKAVACAKEYLTGALRADLQLGKGSGPLNHLWKWYSA